jgi:hypothetical protein
LSVNSSAVHYETAIVKVFSIAPVLNRAGIIPVAVWIFDLVGRLKL